MAKIQIKNSFITSSADITISSSMVKFSSGISAKNITGSFSGSIPALTSYYKQGGSSFGTTAILGTNDNQALTFETNASEKVRIATDGNVGISTTSPGGKLHVVGGGGSGTLVIQGSGITSHFHYGTNEDTYIRPGKTNGAVFIADVGGNVGIGTTTVDAKLRVLGNVRATSFTGSFSGSVVGSNVFVQGGNSFGTTAILGTSDNQALILETNNTEKVRITTAGNVGIGTTIVAATFHVVGQSFLNNVVANTAKNQLTINVNGSNYAQFYDIGVSATNALAIGGSTGITAVPSAPIMTWALSSGNVGIGTSSPAYKLDVIGPGTSNGVTLRLSDAASLANSRHILLTRGSVSGSIGIAGSQTNDPLWISRSSGYDLMVASSGNIGIGTSIPSQLLELKKTSASVIALLNYNDSVKFNINASSGGAGYIGMVSNHPLIFVNNDTERVRIDTSGNVGIGTSSPADKLHVIGNVRINGGDILNWSGQAFIQTLGNYDMFFRPNSTLQMILTGNGNIGIGSGFTNPLAKLHVSGSSTSVSAIFNGNVGIGTTSPSYKLDVLGDAKIGNSSGAGNLWIIGARDWRWIAGTTGYGVGSGFGLFDNTANAYRISVDTNGNVGIGTTSPTYTLHVEGTGTQRINVVSTNNSSTGAGIYFQVKNSGTLVSNSTLTIDNSGNLKIFTGTSSESEKMRIDNNGNVGIGTTTTGGLLSLHGTYPQLVANNPTTGSGVVIQLRDNGRDAGFMGHSTTTSRLQFGSKGSSAAHMTISETGDVGIGTTSPTAQANYRFLQVNGTNSAIIETMVGGTRIGGFDSSATALYVGSIGSYPIVFRTAVNEKMRLDTSGNLLIGNSSGTGYRLNVKSAFASAVGGAYIEVGEFNQKTLVINNTNPSVSSNLFEAQKSGSAVFVINSAGNVGIGTTSPATLLHVDTSGADARIRVSAGTNTVQGGMIANSGTSLVYAGSITNHGFSLRTNDTDRVRIDTNGNVGIGTTTAATKFVVAADATDSDVGQLRVIGSTSNAKMTNVGYHTTNNYGFIQALIAGTGYSPLSIQPNGGNVGIGTTSPNAKLRVIGNVWATSFTGSFSGSVVGSNMFVQGGNSFGTTAILGTSDNQALILETNNSEKLRITTAGNVGIGTTNPFSKLDVRGNLYVNYGSNGTGYIQTNGSDSDLQITIATNLTTLMNTGGSGAMAFGAGNSERMRITAAGNVGIGTTGPSSAASFNKVVEAYDGTSISYQVNSGGTYKAEFGISSAGGWLGTSTTHDMRLVSNGTERMRILSGGNVGIGSSSPAYKLDVYDGNQDVARFYNNQTSFGLILGSTANTLFTNLLWTTSTGNAQFFKNRSSTSWGGADSFNFYTSNGGFAWHPAGTFNAMYLTTSGNLGIGTTSPATILQVVGTGVGAVGTVNIKGASVHLGLTSAAGSFKGWYGYFNTTTHGSDNDLNIKTGYAGTSNIRFSADGDTTAAMLYIKSDGNVGIGTTSPATKFEMYGGNMVLKMTGVTTGSIQFKNSSGTKIQEIRYDDSDGSMTLGSAIGPYPVKFITSNTERVRIAGDGNVGIGTTSPAYKLDVNGTFRTATNNLTLFNDYIYVSPTENNTLNSAYFTNGIADMWINYAGYNNGNTQFRNFNVGNGKNGIIAWFDGTNKRMSINNNQAASYTLDVNGTIGLSGSPFASYSSNYNRIFEPAGNVAIYLGNATDPGNYYDNTTHNFRSRAGGTNYVIINSSGNVGIGTTSPTSQLQLSGSLQIGNGTNFGNKLTIYDNFTDGKIAIALRQSTGASVGDDIFSLYCNSTTGEARLLADDDNGVGFMTFYMNASERMRITNGGNVGIGSSSPAYKLDINGTGRFTGDLTTNGNIVITRAGAYLYINGTNSDAEIVWQTNGSHRWAMGMNVGDATENFNIYNYTTATTNFTILKANGNVGIGSTAPNDKLDVVGRVYAYRYIAVSSNASLPAYATDTSTGMFNAATNQIGFTINGSERLRIDSNGNVLIGGTSTTNSPIEFQQDGDAFIKRLFVTTTSGNANVYINSQDGYESLLQFGGQTNYNNGIIKYSDASNFMSFWTSATEKMRITSGGNVGIGTTSPISKLNTYASGSNLSVFRVDGGNGTLFEVTDQLSGSLFSVNDVSGLPLLEVFSNNRIVAGKYNTNALVISGSSVGIGTATPAYKLQVNGSFGATTKSFVIDHPTKQGKKLVYGSLESPYHGIRLTGRNVLIDGECKVQLPDYIYKLARSESVNIQITPIKCGKVIYVDEISVPNNYFVVKYDKSMFESYKNYEFFWDFTATRNDVDELIVEQ